MISFIEEYYEIGFRSAEIFAALAGIIFFKKYKYDKAAKYLIYFLIYVNVIEVVAHYPTLLQEDKSLKWLKDLLSGTAFLRNYWWYFIAWFIGSNVFFSFYYYLISESKKIQFYIKYLCFVTVSVQLIFFIMFIRNLDYDFMIYTEVINLLVILFLVSTYFMQLINSEKLVVFYKTIPFYVTVAAFVFTITTTPLVFFERYFNLSDPDYISLKYVVNFFAIIFMYSLIGLGIIVSEAEVRK